MEEPRNLMETTRRLIRQDGRTYLQLYEATGISPYWIERFTNGAFKNPSVNRVQQLYEALTGKPLEI